jgi:hypothetical protein
MPFISLVPSCTKYWHSQKTYAIFEVILNPPSHEKIFHQNAYQ